MALKKAIHPGVRMNVYWEAQGFAGAVFRF
jgi:hypothetical protein